MTYITQAINTANSIKKELYKAWALREIATLSINDKEEDAKFATMIMSTFNR